MTDQLKENHQYESKLKINRPESTFSANKLTTPSLKEVLEANKSAAEVETAPEDQTTPNPNFSWGSQSFVLKNGDTYDGGYCCHKTGIIWREGDGVYFTKDGHIYGGTWENDQLLNSPVSQVVYPSLDEYNGCIVKGKYSGEGLYVFNNKLMIKATFEDNKPIGEITLIDYEGYLWKGRAHEKSTIILCVNNFFESLPADRGVGKTFKAEDKKELVEEAKSVISEGQLKRLVFEKSTKTKNDFTLDSEVCETKKKKDISEKKVSSEMSITLLKTFLSREYRTKNIAIPVFTPTCDQDKVEEERLQNEELIPNEETIEAY